MNSYFFTDKIDTVKRLKNLDSYRTAISATLTVYYGSLQTMNDNRIQLSGGKLGQMYEYYCDISVPIVEGDKVYINSVCYMVQGVGDYNMGSPTHKRLILVKEQL